MRTLSPQCDAASLADLTWTAESVLECRVESVTLLPGGYTAQPVMRLGLAGGSSCVMKAAPPASVDARLDWPAELQREIDLYATHPELDAWRPRALGEFRTGGWRALLMEDLGSPLLQAGWTEGTTAAVAAGLAALHATTAGLGGALVHNDVRSDNLFLGDDGSLRLVDWAEAGRGTPLDDAVYWAVGVHLEGGGRAPHVLARYAAAAGDVDPVGVVDALVRLRQLTVRRLSDPRLPYRVRQLRRRELAVLDAWAVVSGRLRRPGRTEAAST